MDRLIKLLWNNEEKRLRAVWRIFIYGTMTILITALLFTFFILIAGVIFALTSPRIGSTFPFTLVYDQVLALVSNESAILLITSITTLLSVLVLTPFSMKYIDRRLWKPLKRQVTRSWWKELGIGSLAGFFSIALIFALLVAFGNIKITTFTPDFGDSEFFGSIFIALLIFMCVGIYEEVVFRGYVFNNLSESFFCKWIKKENAVILGGVVSSLAFSVLHLTNPSANALSFLNILLIGCLFCLSVLVTGKLGFAIGFHILWNFSQAIIFGVPVSGLAMKGSPLMLEVTGPAWLTGGAFGFEGSVLCLIINLVLTILILLFIKTKNKRLRLNFEIGEYTPGSSPVSDTQILQ